MKSVRQYSPFFPYPPDGGSPHVIFDQICAMSEMGCDVELVCWKETRAAVMAKQAADYIEAFPKDVKVRVLEDHSLWGGAMDQGKPESSLARSLRVALSLSSQFSSSEIYYYPPHRRPQFAEKRDLGVYHYSFAYPWLLQSLSQKNPSEDRRVVVFHNLESELSRIRVQKEKTFPGPDELNQAGISTSIQNWIHTQNTAKMRAHEGELIKLADEIWFISPEDEILWKHRYGTAKTRFVGPGFSSQLRKKRLEKRTEKLATQSQVQSSRLHGPVLGFVGALNFTPNQQSADWIVEKLAPQLQAKGFQGKILIAGQGAPSELKRKAFPYPFIHFLGFVPDLEQFWSELDWSLVPHVGGSGVRIKLLESIASGVPTLANRAAASRIHPNLLTNGLLFVSDDPNEWCQKILNSPSDGKRSSLRDLLAGQPESSLFPSELNTQKTLAFLSQK